MRASNTTQQASQQVVGGGVSGLHSRYDFGFLYEIVVAENVCRHDTDAHVSKQERVDVVITFVAIE